MKVCTYLRENGKLSNDITVMVDETYLRKCVQYSASKFIGCDKTGEFYKGIIVFMIQGLKHSVPVVVKGCPITALNGEWLTKEIKTCIAALASCGFKVRGVVADNHAANVNAFKILHKMYPGRNNLCIHHPKNETVTNVFFDNVHLLKNIWNNMFNTKKFVFPAFSFNINEIVQTDAGYIAWSDLKYIYEQDSKLSANLRKAYKLTLKSVNPINNKQNVNLALSIFHETTIAASKSYCPNRKDLHTFLTLVNKWWTIVNARARFSPNSMANAIVEGDGKLLFLISLADWFSAWSETRTGLCLSKQTFQALIKTLRAQAQLMTELLQEGYLYVIPAKLQTDPLEKRFSQYRQTSGGNFLVSLREVLQSEKTLLCKTLLKEDVTVLQEVLEDDCQLTAEQN